MSFLRSKSISHYQIILPRQNSYRIVSQIGRLGLVQFQGHQLSPNEMPYYSQYKICEDQLEKIKLIELQLLEKGHGMPKDHYSQQEYDHFLEIFDRRYRLSNQSHIHLIQSKAEQLGELWKNLEDLKQRKEYLLNQFEMLRQEMHILDGGKILFEGKLFQGENFNNNQLRQIGFKSGILLKKDEMLIKRTIFRISRGLSVFQTLEEDSVFGNENTDMKEKKVIFYLFFGFGTSEIMQRKINRTLDIYCLKSINYPKNEQDLQYQLTKIKSSSVQNQKLQELVSTELKNMYTRFLQLETNDEKQKLTKLEYYKLFFLSQRCIYQSINGMKVQHSFAQAQIFLEEQKIDEVTKKLQTMLQEDRMPLPQFIPATSRNKPTLFELNSVINTPYQILSAYGVPQYKQINPAIFNLITFPFLFGVMFSDIAHGLVLLSIGILMVFAPNWTEQYRLLKILIPHKYTIILMGFFATYCGFIYNQFLSMDLNIFGSCYDLNQVVDKIPAYDQNCVYPFGVDPIWSISQNQLQFTNSLKMKIAVIIAVVHMTFGLILKGFNQFEREKKRYILLQTVPQIIFFVFLFGYLDFLIFYKWVNAWSPSYAPSIITTMINIPLKLGKTQQCCNGGQPMWGDDHISTSQNNIQLFILIISVVCLPLILCLKPIEIGCQNRRRIKNEHDVDFESELKSSKIWESQNVNQNLIQTDLAQGAIDMSEVIVHQIIQTIEFALGSISNTASYLRLWALSLAHQQLSEVFFEQTVQRGITYGYAGIPISLVLFPIFAGITFGILLCMDSMECFLHTLRLHWVQFQNKFYKGDGKEFKRFNLRDISNEWIKNNAIGD